MIPCTGGPKDDKCRALAEHYFLEKVGHRLRAVCPDHLADLALARIYDVVKIVNRDEYIEEFVRSVIES
jgi:hypothetical protein